MYMRNAITSLCSEGIAKKHISFSAVKTRGFLGHRQLVASTFFHSPTSNQCISKSSGRM